MAKKNETKGGAPKAAAKAEPAKAAAPAAPPAAKVEPAKIEAAPAPAPAPTAAAPSAPAAAVVEARTHGFRRKLVGRVTSSKMNKTVVVEVVRSSPDPVYKKYVR